MSSLPCCPVSLRLVSLSPYLSPDLLQISASDEPGFPCQQLPALLLFCARLSYVCMLVSVSLSLSLSLHPVCLFFSPFTKPTFSRMVRPGQAGSAQDFFLLKENLLLTWWFQLWVSASVKHLETILMVPPSLHRCSQMEEDKATAPLDCLQGAASEITVTLSVR